MKIFYIFPKLSPYFSVTVQNFSDFFTFSSYEKVLVLCEKLLSEFSSNLHVLRPTESEKTVFTKSVCLLRV